MSFNSDKAYMRWYEIDEERFVQLRNQGLSKRAAKALSDPDYDTREKILQAYKTKGLLKRRQIGVVTYNEIGKWLNEKEPVCPHCGRPL
jgi:ribosomal protein S27AE